jgi:hypothetical protein
LLNFLKEVRKNKVRSLLNFVGAEINPYFKYLTKSSRKQGPILMDIKGKLKTSYIKSNGKFERYNRSCRNKINGHMEELGILIKPPDAYMAFRNIIQATLPHIPVVIRYFLFLNFECKDIFCVLGGAIKTHSHKRMALYE